MSACVLLARQLAVEAVAGDERHLLARCDRRDRRDVRMPAVVRRRGRDPHSNAATSSAACAAASISPSIHSRGSPSWWSERIATSCDASKIGVTI